MRDLCNFSNRNGHECGQCRLQLSSRARGQRHLFSSERSTSGASECRHKSGLRFDQKPKLLRPNEMQDEKELRKRLLQDSTRHGEMRTSLKSPYDAVCVWFTERDRRLKVVVVGASISMRAHSDSRMDGVFLGESWFFSALFWTLTEKIPHSALTSRKTGEETNEPPKASSMRASTHRAFNIGSDGWERPDRSKPDASHAVRRRGRGTTTAPSVGTTQRCKTRATQRLNQHGHACAHARLHICTTFALPETRRSPSVSVGRLAQESTRLHGAVFER